MKCIYERQENRIKFEASLHNMKIGNSSQKPGDEIELTEDEKKIVDENKKLALERIRERHGGRKD